MEANEVKLKQAGRDSVAHQNCSFRLSALSIRILSETDDYYFVDPREAFSLVMKFQLKERMK